MPLKSVHVGNYIPYRTPTVVPATYMSSPMRTYAKTDILHHANMYNPSNIAHTQV